MKKMTKMIMGATFVVGALTAGCQTTATLPAPVSQPVTETALQAHNWQLVDAKRMNGERVTALFFDPAKPLTLSFMNDDGRNYVAFMNTCNNMSAGYSVVNGDVQIKNGISTMMACPEPASQLRYSSSRHGTRQV